MNYKSLTNKHKSIKMKHYIIILLLILPLLSYGQQKYNPKPVKASTKIVVGKIKRVNKLMGSAVYRHGMRPKQYDNFEKLKEIASKEELIALTNHPNGVVRCYAFWALSYHKSVDLFPIVLNHIRDEKIVNTQFGCIGDRVMVGDFFIDVVTPRYIDLESTKLDSVQRAKLDSILIYSDSKLKAKSWAIYDAKPTESLYPRIKEIYVKDNNQYALVTLAKYRKTEDIPLILNNKEHIIIEDEDDKYYKYEYDNYFYTYEAIQKFPHNDFVSLLEKKLYESLDKKYLSFEWYGLYEAIAAYKNEKSVELLTVPFTQVQHENIRKYHLKYAHNAIRKHKNEIYDSLLWEFWIEENIISPDIFQYLLEKDSIKVFELTKENFANMDKINSINSFLFSNSRDLIKSIVQTMLDLILKNDYEFGFEMIREYIKKANGLLITNFIEKVIELKDKSFIEPLFERLAKEDNPHVYLKVTEALLSYQDDAINKRILETLKINDNLNKNWGGKKLDELLKKHNVK